MSFQQIVNNLYLRTNVFDQVNNIHRYLNLQSRKQSQLCCFKDYLHYNRIDLFLECANNDYFKSVEIETSNQIYLSKIDIFNSIFHQIIQYNNIRAFKHVVEMIQTNFIDRGSKLSYMIKIDCHNVGTYEMAVEILKVAVEKELFDFVSINLLLIKLIENRDLKQLQANIFRKDKVLQISQVSMALLFDDSQNRGEKDSLLDIIKFLLEKCNYNVVDLFLETLKYNIRNNAKFMNLVELFYKDQQLLEEIDSTSQKKKIGNFINPPSLKVESSLSPNHVHELLKTVAYFEKWNLEANSSKLLGSIQLVGIDFLKYLVDQDETSYLVNSKIFGIAMCHWDSDCVNFLIGILVSSNINNRCIVDNINFNTISIEILETISSFNHIAVEYEQILINILVDDYSYIQKEIVKQKKQKITGYLLNKIYQESGLNNVYGKAIMVHDFFVAGIIERLAYSQRLELDIALELHYDQETIQYIIQTTNIELKQNQQSVISISPKILPRLGTVGSEQSRILYLYFENREKLVKDVVEFLVKCCAVNHDDILLDSLLVKGEEMGGIFSSLDYRTIFEMACSKVMFNRGRLKYGTLTPTMIQALILSNQHRLLQLLVADENYANPFVMASSRYTSDQFQVYIVDPLLRVMQENIKENKPNSEYFYFIKTAIGTIL
ncbi:hypothetical protein DFA_10552 [Cavenderia fasciculata]|uniref:Uncharacterized protein n=1 Tax=Cavenderia fasciculata TaxID=261658 RepID=F4QAJ1_CACFS|nr:uncharacterized protein DFA_10552 [Cavenderia fasciculata]EGG15710.1 hypothetical protein DFA_10552 [Cavenderia fasciculata]|eukprot:XP_004354452.1 hypothetical protein DFA_10552 [Cavenderia fasciculata]